MEPATDIQLLSDPCNDRVMKSMAPPPHKALTVESLYKGGMKIEHLLSLLLMILFTSKLLDYNL